MDSYQRKKYPELIHSHPRHDRTKEKLTEKNIQVDKVGGRLSQKETLMKTLESIYAKSKSLDDFLAKLRSKGHEPYYRGKDKRLQGIKLRETENSDCLQLASRRKLHSFLLSKLKKKKTLSELRDLRESRASGREQNDSRESISSEKNIEEKDDGIGRIPGVDIDKEDHTEEDEEQITDDNDDLV